MYDVNAFITSWALSMREHRHNPCLMIPVSVVVLILFSAFSLFCLLMHIPEMILGLLLAPVLHRAYWFVEFLYPMGVARWGHFFILRFSSKKKRIKKNNQNTTAATGSSMDAAIAVNNIAQYSHSRCIEQRIQVVKDRVYIHPIPQLLDNIGYLVVSLPPNNNINNNNSNNTNAPIVAFLIDCGDAQAAMEYMDAIQHVHYPGYQSSTSPSIQLHSILCTHKHHDHTAGNEELLNAFGSTTLHHIYGGAVERVPHCTKKVVNGQFLDLPRVNGNDMNDLVHVEVIAVPAHTRGSVMYALRLKQQQEHQQQQTSFLFTGDTMFSGGGGVPFEADTENPREQKNTKQNGNTPIRGTAGRNAIERCFAEIITRAHGNNNRNTIGTNNERNILLFPGHEYTSELMSRQFAPSQSSQMEDSCLWSRLPPSVFFQIASHLYISNHRRSLPKKSKLLTVPTPLSRELVINPHFRIMKKRGQNVTNAIRLWHRYFSTVQINSNSRNCEAFTIMTTTDARNGKQGASSNLQLTASFSGMAATSPGPSVEQQHQKQKQQTNQYSESANGSSAEHHHLERPPSPISTSPYEIVASDFTKPVFTTIYSSDLDSIIRGLKTKEIDSETAADLLAIMKKKLDAPPVGRRPIPGTLPTDKNIFEGVLGLALLGSPPSALTLSDSRIMNLPSPIEYRNSDRIQISKRRLIDVLGTLGLLHTEELVPPSLLSPKTRAGYPTNNLHTNNDNGVIQMIHLLWKEAEMYNSVSTSTSDNDGLSLNTKPSDKKNYNATDLEENGNDDGNDLSDSVDLASDNMDLGLLKWILYGVEMNHPSWFSRFCMPCGAGAKNTARKPHPVDNSGMRRSRGELVRHDVETCPVCNDSVIGCHHGIPAEQQTSDDTTTFIGYIENDYVSTNSGSIHGSSTHSGSIRGASGVHFMRSPDEIGDGNTRGFSSVDIGYVEEDDGVELEVKGNYAESLFDSASEGDFLSTSETW